MTDERRPSRGRARPRRRRARCWRRHDVRRGQLVGERVAAPHVDVDAVRRGVGVSSPRPRSDRRRARRRARSRASRAAIESTPEPQPTSSRLPRVDRFEQLEAEPRRRVRARAERAPGSITTASASSGGAPARAGRSTSSRARRPVEAAPALGPVVRDVLAAHAAERLPEPLLAGAVGVGDELDAVVGVRAPRSPPGRARASAPAPPRPARRGPRRRRGAAASAEGALQLVEEPLVRPVRLLAGRSLELLEQASLRRRSAGAGRAR